MNKTISDVLTGRPAVYVLGIATLIPPVLFFMDFHALFVWFFIGVPLIFISLACGYRNLSRHWSSLVWLLALIFFWFMVLPVFWYYKIYLPHSRIQLTPAETDRSPAPRDD